jgi:hypothetical protein
MLAAASGLLVHVREQLAQRSAQLALGRSRGPARRAPRARRPGACSALARRPAAKEVGARRTASARASERRRRGAPRARRGGAPSSRRSASRSAAARSRDYERRLGGVQAIAARDRAQHQAGLRQARRARLASRRGRCAVLRAWSPSATHAPGALLEGAQHSVARRRKKRLDLGARLARRSLRRAGHPGLGASASGAGAALPRGRWGLGSGADGAASGRASRRERWRRDFGRARTENAHRRFSRRRKKHEHMRASRAMARGQVQGDCLPSSGDGTLLTVLQWLVSTSRTLFLGGVAAPG